MPNINWHIGSALIHADRTMYMTRLISYFREYANAPNMSATHFGTALFGHKLIYLMLLLGSSPITKREKETNIPYGIHDAPPPLLALFVDI